MNNYPVWWDTTVTVYNKFEDSQTHIIRWFRTVINGAFWKNVGEQIKVAEVVLETNNIICRIRKDARFKEAYEWINTPNDVMINYFTLKPGDIIIKGEVQDDIDEYAKGKRSTDILQKYKALQGCLVIQDVGINVGAGRGNEHYHVRGV